MKQYALPFLLNLALLATSSADLEGQTPCGDAYTRIIAEGDAFMKQGNYKEAFEKYRAAGGCAESEHQVLDQKKADVLHAVDGEREKADKSAAMARQQQKKAEAALRNAKEATAKAEAAEKKASAVLNKIYFYEDRFGLAYENGRYGFIDKSLKTKIPFKYIGALPFDQTGFAFVRRLNGDTLKQIEFMLDTLGNEYPLAYDIADIKENTTALDLRNSEIDNLPGEIFRHTQLKVLLQRGNLLTQLPPEIGRLKNLVFLGLSTNKLKQLPKELGDLENLRELQIFENYLTDLPTEIGNLKNLVSLDISDNQLTNVTSALGNLTKLVSLNLSNNQLQQLPPESGNLKSLIRLDLSNNQLKQLPPELGNLSTLRTLYLNGNSLPVEEISRIKAQLPNCKIRF